MNFTLKARAAARGALLTIVFTAAAGAQPSVTTYHNDISRTGLNPAETVLTPANVRTASFGKLFSLPVDGAVYGQPLYIPKLSIPGKGVHNVIFVTTQHDSVYAFDADSNTGANAAPLWKASLLDAAHGAASGATSEPSSDLNNCGDIPPEVGITGSAVIDPAAGTLYVVAKTNEGGKVIQRLHALDVTTGAERGGSPAAIQASVPGTGAGSASGVLAFDPKWSLQRTGLLLVNGYVYLAFGSHCDFFNWHGWVMSYNASTLKLASAFAATPNGAASGIWMSGGAPAAETVNGVTSIYVSTGNGNFDANHDYGDDLLKLKSVNGVLSIADSFTPYNQSALASADADLSSGGVLLLPIQAGAHSRLMLTGGKLGELYLVDRDNLGGYSASNNNVVQDLPNQLGGLWGTPSYFNNAVYVWGSTYQTGKTGEGLKVYSLTNGLMSTSPVTTSSRTSLFPGPTLSISSNGGGAGIVWAVLVDQYDSGGNAVLVAHDATNISNPIYASDQNTTRDAVGRAIKFSVPTVVNGKVYVGWFGGVSVYGLLPTKLPATPANVAATPLSSSSLKISWTASTTPGVTYNVYVGTTPASTLSPSSRITGITGTSYTATGLPANTVFYGRVTAVNSNGESAPSNLVSASTFSSLSCKASYSVYAQILTSFGAYLNIQNTGSSPINGWTATWAWPSGQTITLAAAGTYTQNGANATLSNPSGVIPAGSSTGQIVLVGNTQFPGINTAPGAFYLNGALCQ